MSNEKYTKEILQEAVFGNTSMFGVLRTLNISTNSGSMHYHLSRKIKNFKIDTSHFLGIRSNRGIAHKGGNKKKTASEILVLKTSGIREKTSILRRALLEIGRKYECECGCSPLWRGKKLVLQIDHGNGNELDNRSWNLKFLCPNCHSQTETYSKPKSYGQVAQRQEALA